jgi:SEC-C motif-containing protein
MGSSCPCGSGVSYQQCCEPFHNGGEPPTALLLMRSRYSAYARSRADYIQRTTHPKSPYFEQNRKKWTAAILEFCHTTRFTKLEILGHGEDWVSFAAHLLQGGKPVVLRERSHFEKDGSHWRYLQGELNVTEA